LISSEALLGLPGYQITGVEERSGVVTLSVRYTGPINCPFCEGQQLRVKALRMRRLRHESWGLRATVVELETRKWKCRSCGKYFWQRFPGIMPRKRATEPFRRSIFVKHWDGISRSRLSERERIGSATVERWFHDFLRRQAADRAGNRRTLLLLASWVMRPPSAI
jgi:transposase-like protein